jgi:hypothetical protein
MFLLSKSKKISSSYLRFPLGKKRKKRRRKRPKGKERERRSVRGEPSRAFYLKVS